MSRLNVWTRALSFEQEIPSLVENCQGAAENFEGLALRWNGYDMLSGKVEKVVPSNCATYLCPQTVDPGVCSVDAKDKNGPTVKMCPQDVYIESDKKEVNVTWPEPVFSDEVMLDKIEHNLKPGQVFTWGDYLV